MKGSSLIVSIILFVAVAVLYVLHFAEGESTDNLSSGLKPASGNATGVRIAYVKADSIILNYNLAEDLHDDFTKKQEAYTTEYGSKRQAFERDAAAFQEKLQRGGFLTEQRAIQERDRLLGIEQEVTKLDQELSNKLADLQATNNEQVLDSLMSCVNNINAIKKYDYIFNAANILIGSEADNITGEVLKMMNERYQKK
jgi:outer membrane protein